MSFNQILALGNMIFPLPIVEIIDPMPELERCLNAISEWPPPQGSIELGETRTTFLQVILRNYRTASSILK